MDQNKNVYKEQKFIPVLGQKLTGLESREAEEIPAKNGVEFVGILD